MLLIFCWQRFQLQRGLYDTPTRRALFIVFPVKEVLFVFFKQLNIKQLGIFPNCYQKFTKMLSGSLCA